MEDMTSVQAALPATPDLAANPVVQKLDALSISHNTYPHALSNTADELVANVPLSDDNDTHTKNLFFKDKKGAKGR